jgi:hypothetical protein
MADARKPRPKPARSIRLVRPVGADGVGVFCVTTARESVFYAVREIPCAIGGRGFVVHRLGLGNLYHVRIGAPEECTCECKGFLRHGHCRHVLGLLALAREGKL